MTILDYIATHPGCSGGEIAAALNTPTTAVRFTSRGREYEVDERLITTIDKHRSEKDAHHIYLTDGTYFCATNVARVNLIRQVQEPRR